MPSTSDPCLSDPTPDYEKPAFRARAAVDRAVAEIVTHTLGEDGFTQQARPGLDPKIWGPTRAPRPLPALAAALTVQTAATAAVDRAARDARTDGHSWLEIADTLGAEPEADPYDRAVAAYERFADDVDQCRYRAVWFRCRACTAMVRDHGPYENHPEDRETGHTPDCPRHTAAITTYERDL